MKHIKLYEDFFIYEGLFDIFKKVKRPSIRHLDEDLLNDILIEDLEDLQWYGFSRPKIIDCDEKTGVDCSSIIEYSKEFYACDHKGNPIMTKDTWFGTPLLFTKRKTGFSESDISKNYQGITLGISLNSEISKQIRHSLGNPSGSKKEGAKDISKDHFDFINFIFNKLNKERLKDFEIGCCLFLCNRNLFGDYRILFYPL
jgi:hypothetical protein